MYLRVRAGDLRDPNASGYAPRGYVDWLETLMFVRPVLLPTSAKDETFAGVTYHVDGELVPALTVEISAAQSIYFEHHIMLWKTNRP